MYEEAKIKFHLSRTINGKRQALCQWHFIGEKLFSSIIQKKNPITRVIDWNAQWRSIKAAKSRLMKSYGGERGGTANGYKSKVEFKSRKKKYFPQKSRVARVRGCVDIIVRKLSLSIFRRVIVRLTEARSLRNHPGTLRTTIIFTLQPHKGGRGIHRSRN